MSYKLKNHINVQNIKQKYIIYIYNNILTKTQQQATGSKDTNTVYHKGKQFPMSTYSHAALTSMHTQNWNLCTMTNFSLMQGLWLAVVKLHKHVYSNVHKQTDECQCFSVLWGYHSYEDLATKIFVYTKESCPQLQLSRTKLC